MENDISARAMVSGFGLQPFDVQFVVIAGSNSAVVGKSTSFAILDGNGTSASGVAAAVVRPGITGVVGRE